MFVSTILWTDKNPLTSVD